MILLLVSLIISASTESELNIINGTQSSTAASGYEADRAYDNNMYSTSSTNKAMENWLMLYFEEYSMVGNVTIKGDSSSSECWFSVMVFDNADMSNMTPCGRYQAEDIYGNETVDCQNARGDGVMLAQTDCNKMMMVYDVSVYGSAACKDGQGMNKTTGKCQDCDRDYYGWENMCYECPDDKRTMQMMSTYDECLESRYVNCGSTKCSFVDCPCYDYESCSGDGKCYVDQDNSSGMASLNAAVLIAGLILLLC